jgi:branched-chain amino acid transport system ATP-binding protein
MSAPDRSGLSVEGVRVSYQNATAIHDVSLHLPPGKRISIVGRNSAGKSSLLKSIAGAVLPSAGKIYWNGKDITKYAPHRRVKLGISMVPEGRRIFPGLSVESNLRVGGFVSPGTVAERRAMVFELFPPLRELRRRQAASLSGGEAQMLAIGQSLMSNPKLLLMDEPSLGLAPIVVSMLLETMIALSEQGISVLLVEQSVQLASHFSEDVYLIDEGRMQVVRAEGQELNEASLQEAYLGEAT